MPGLGLVGKAKVALGYFQVVLVMPEAFAVRLPPEYFRWMQAFDWLDLDVVRLLIPPECVGSFARRLRLRALAPLATLLVLVSVAALDGARKSIKAGSATLRAGAQDGAQAGATRMLPLLLAGLFALVPYVSARIFAAFSCETFGSVGALEPSTAFH